MNNRIFYSLDNKVSDKQVSFLIVSNFEQGSSYLESSLKTDNIDMYIRQTKYRQVNCSWTISCNFVWESLVF